MTTNEFKAVLSLDLTMCQKNYEMELREAAALLTSSSGRTPQPSLAQNLAVASQRLADAAARYQQTQRILQSLEN